MAEAFTNSLASARGLDVKAISAGTLGGSKLNPTATAAMSEIGISMADQYSKLLTQPMADAATRIISMGCGVDAAACPAQFLLTEDWKLDDPAGQGIDSVRVIRDQILARVEAMLDELESTSG